MPSSSQYRFPDFLASTRYPSSQGCNARAPVYTSLARSISSALLSMPRHPPANRTTLLSSISLQLQQIYTEAVMYSVASQGIIEAFVSGEDERNRFEVWCQASWTVVGWHPKRLNQATESLSCPTKE